MNWSQPVLKDYTHNDILLQAGNEREDLDKGQIFRGRLKQPGLLFVHRDNLSNDRVTALVGTPETKPLPR